MASHSFRNVISTIAMANGIAIVIKRHTSAATPNELAGNLDARCREAFECWPGSIDQKEMSRIWRQLEGFEREFIPVQGRPEFLTSITLGLIDDVMWIIKDPVKRTALTKLETALWKLHCYYDRRLDKHDIYDLANVAIEHWNQGVWRV